MSWHIVYFAVANVPNCIGKVASRGGHPWVRCGPMCVFTCLSFKLNCQRGSNELSSRMVVDALDAMVRLAHSQRRIGIAHDSNWTSRWRGWLHGGACCKKSIPRHRTRHWHFCVVVGTNPLIVLHETVLVLRAKTPLT